VRAVVKLRNGRSSQMNAIPGESPGYDKGAVIKPGVAETRPAKGAVASCKAIKGRRDGEFIAAGNGN